MANRVCGKCGAVTVAEFCGSCGTPQATAHSSRPDPAGAPSSANPMPTGPPPRYSAQSSASVGSMPGTSSAPWGPQPTAAAPFAPQLLQGERIVAQDSFTPNLIFKHLRTTIVVTDCRVIVQSPHVLFGVIPFGESVASAPLEEIEQVRHGNLVNPRSLRIGVALLLCALLFFLLGVTGMFDSGPDYYGY